MPYSSSPPLSCGKKRNRDQRKTQQTTHCRPSSSANNALSTECVLALNVPGPSFRVNRNTKRKKSFHIQLRLRLRRRLQLNRGYHNDVSNRNEWKQSSGRTFLDNIHQRAIVDAVDVVVVNPDRFALQAVAKTSNGRIQHGNPLQFRQTLEPTVHLLAKHLDLCNNIKTIELQFILVP